MLRETHAYSKACAQALPAIDDLKVLTANRIVAELRRAEPYYDIQQAEFKVFSQFGDDGIIQYLIHHCRVDNTQFIEFGASNYRECNTRFLLVNDNWRGLIIDGSVENIASVKAEDIYWRHDLTAVSNFITRETINETFVSHGFAGDIGLLSIDIDGNDYWVWEAIDSVNPIIVVCEYNSLFGASRAVTVPYDAAFNRRAAHYSSLYWGCSLRALCLLADRKGYAFVGSNRNGNNAYFVRNDRLGSVRRRTAEDGYVEARYRDSCDPAGHLSFVGGVARVSLIASMPLIDIETNREIKVADLGLGG